MDDPIAYFLTWATYGVWLPGDGRGWTQYQSGWRLPDPILELEAAARMSEKACRLSKEARVVVERQLAETCDRRGWTLHAANCRSNHLHVVVGAPRASPQKVRADLKAWSARRLREEVDPERTHWWGERGSVRWIFNDAQLESVLVYVVVAQDRKHLDQ